MAGNQAAESDKLLFTRSLKQFLIQTVAPRAVAMLCIADMKIAVRYSGRPGVTPTTPETP